MNRLINVLNYSSDGFSEYNSASWLVSRPMDEINRQGLANVRTLNARHWLYSTPEYRRASDWADIIIVHRVLTSETHKQVTELRNRGKAVVLSGDDSYEKILDSNASAKFWKGGMVTITLGDGTTYDRPMDIHPIDQFRKGVSLCTASASPSELLCKDWSKYAPSFHIPNYINKDMYTFPTRKQFDRNRIVIGWGGSLSHTQSFENSGVMEALQHIMGRNKNIYLLIVGDKRVLDLLPLPKDRLLYLHYVKWNEWPILLNSWYDIGIAPLAGEYDMRRSWIKPLEYVAEGIPFVATHGYPYKQFFGKFDPAGGLFVDQGDLDKGNIANPDGWESALQTVIDEIDERRQVRLDVSEFMLQNRAKDIVKTYEEIIKIN